MSLWKCEPLLTPLSLDSFISVHMNLPSTIESTLNRHAIPYRLHTHRLVRTLNEAVRECDIPEGQLARGVLLEDHLGVLLAVLPLNHSIDFAAVRRITGRDLQPAQSDSAARIFTDCENGTVPPLARCYKIGAIVDSSLTDTPQVCFEPGDRRILVCMETEEFLRLHSKSQLAPFSQPLDALAGDDTMFVSNSGTDKLQQLRPLGNIAERVRTMKELPSIPPLAAHLLRIHRGGEATVAELSAIVAQDPALSAQLIRHARSTRPNLRERIDTLDDAIAQVLGFDLALNMALGIAISHHFNTASDGPVGLHAFWRHAVFSASLAESLARQMPGHLAVAPGTAYLAGLLHNIGFLVMGHMLQPEFYLLNRVVDANPDVPITLVEKRLLGIGHTHIGAWLMRSWQMPEAIVTTVREHHNEVHRGEHSLYVHLMIVVDCLLKSYGIGDGPSRSVPPGSLNQVGLDLHRATELAEQLIDDAEGLNGLANQLCA